MQTKTIQLEIPEYVSIQQYADINSYTGEDSLGKLIYTVSKITGRDIKEVSMWSIDSLRHIADIFSELANHGEQFHSIIEWKGQLYGYAHTKQATLGEYVDLENLCKDLHSNMHKVAAIFYRPIKKHRFKSLKFITKQTLKIANNDVENVFDWYTLEKYDSEKRKEVEEDFKDFPVNVFLGALSFFLTTASQYLNNIAYSANKMTQSQMTEKNNELLGSLLVHTGAGGGLFTTSQSPIYYQYQEISQ